MFGSKSRFLSCCAGPDEVRSFGCAYRFQTTIDSGCRTVGEWRPNGSVNRTPIGSYRSPGSTTSSIGRCSATAKSTSSSPTASRKSARGRARKRRGTNVSVLAWGPIMASAMMEAGLRSQILSLLAGATENSHVVFLRPDRYECRSGYARAFDSGVSGRRTWELRFHWGTMILHPGQARKMQYSCRTAGLTMMARPKYFSSACVSHSTRSTRHSWINSIVSGSVSVASICFNKDRSSD